MKREASLEELLQAYYDLEINIHLSSFWDGKWTVGIDGIGEDIEKYRAVLGNASLELVKKFLIEHLGEGKNEVVAQC